MTEQNAVEQNIPEQNHALAAAEPESDQHKQNMEKLELADEAERCGHARADGAPCLAPAMKGSEMCYAHTRMLAARPRKLRLPPLEDANGVQLAIMEVTKAFIDGVIEHKQAALLLYGLQIAASNVGRATFASLADDSEMVTDVPELLEAMQQDAQKKDAASVLEDTRSQPLKAILG